MSLQIVSPFQQFFDRDGSPLDNGFVYVGIANLNPETNPLTIFFDDALAIPAAQPLRTSNGYIVRNGSPARLYTSQEDFSLTVRDKNGVLVFTAADATSLSNLQAQLAAPSGSSLVGYNEGSANAVDRTVQSRLRDFVSVADFGAVGDGVADDAAAVQAAIDSVETLGGNLFFPPGRYLFGSQVTINRTFASSGSSFVGERNLIISGYGAEIRTTGAITAFDVRGGWLPNHNCLIEGFTIYHRGNTQSVGGIRMIGAGRVTCREVSVVVSSSLPAGYAAFSMENLDPANPDTGCFWNLIEQCSVRPWAGAEGFCDYGVKLMGAANATTLRDNALSGSNTHVILMTHPGQAYVANAVNIDGNFFEGPTTATAINLVGANVAGAYNVSGCRITNNRFEALNTAVALTGTGSTVQLPTYMSGNYADTAVTNYVVNTLDIPIVMLDFVLVGSPMGPAKMVNQAGLLVESQNNSFDPVTIIPANIGRGILLQRNDGVDLGSLRYSTAAGGVGMQIAGTLSPYRPLTIKGLRGLSQSDTSAANLAGTSNFVAATSRIVTLPNAEADANYLIFLMPQANQKLWISARTTTTFTVESDVSSSNGFGWLLVRHL
jgi:hypothetical protein